MNTMYAATYRTRDCNASRVGIQAAEHFVVVMLESIVLSVCGGILGACWPCPFTDLDRHRKLQQFAEVSFNSDHAGADG
jgi:hypothetical protein